MSRSHRLLSRPSRSHPRRDHLSAPVRHRDRGRDLARYLTYTSSPNELQAGVRLEAIHMLDVTLTNLPLRGKFTACGDQGLFNVEQHNGLMCDCHLFQRRQG